MCAIRSLECTKTSKCAIKIPRHAIILSYVLIHLKTRFLKALFHPTHVLQKHSNAPKDFKSAKRKENALKDSNCHIYHKNSCKTPKK